MLVFIYEIICFNKHKMNRNQVHFNFVGLTRNVILTDFSRKTHTRYIRFIRNKIIGIGKNCLETLIVHFR